MDQSKIIDTHLTRITAQRKGGVGYLAGHMASTRDDVAAATTAGEGQDPSDRHGSASHRTSHLSEDPSDHLSPICISWKIMAASKMFITKLL